MADPAQVVQWVRGEIRRPVPVDARGASLGLQLVELGTPIAAGQPQPNSCGEGLRSLLPIPGQRGVVLLSNDRGELSWYSGSALRPIPTPQGVPPVGALLGVTALASPLQVLVTTLDGSELWELEITDRVVAASRIREGTHFGDRRSLLTHYQAGRCTHGEQGCMVFVRDDQGLTVDRRAHPEANPEIVLVLGEVYAADVGYADPEGTSVYLLTPQSCEPPAPSPRATGVVEP